MVVNVVNEDRIASIEREYNPPIAAHLDGPVPPKLAGERMQIPTRCDHILG